MKPKLLDLFCGAGGAAMGYHRAGFEVVGVDIKPQKHYPFEFHQADAMTYPLDGFDVIHASPPCQAYSVVTPATRRCEHPDLIEPIRARLLRSGHPYIIENVSGARRLLKAKFMLCGSMFGLKVWRHRWFECPSLPAKVDSPVCLHNKRPIDVSGTGGRRINRRENDHGGNMNKPRNIREARDAMDIDWMIRYEISQAIPPAYTEFIGKQLMKCLNG